MRFSASEPGPGRPSPEEKPPLGEPSVVDRDAVQLQYWLRIGKALLSELLGILPVLGVAWAVLTRLRKLKGTRFLTVSSVLLPEHKALIRVLVEEEETSPSEDAPAPERSENRGVKGARRPVSFD